MSVIQRDRTADGGSVKLVSCETFHSSNSGKIICTGVSAFIFVFDSLTNPHQVTMDITQIANSCLINQSFTTVKCGRPQSCETTLVGFSEMSSPAAAAEKEKKIKLSFFPHI